MAKAVWRGKFIVVSAYIKKEKKISNNLSLHFKNSEKKNRLIPKLEEEKTITIREKI